MDATRAAISFSPKNSAYEITEFVNLFQLLGTRRPGRNSPCSFRTGAGMTTCLTNDLPDVDSANTWAVWRQQTDLSQCSHGLEHLLKLPKVWFDVAAVSHRRRPSTVRTRSLQMDGVLHTCADCRDCLR